MPITPSNQIVKLMAHGSGVQALGSDKYGHIVKMGNIISFISVIETKHIVITSIIPSYLIEKNHCQYGRG